MCSTSPSPRGMNTFARAVLDMPHCRLGTGPTVKGAAAALECKVTPIQPLHGVNGNDGT